MRQQLKMLIKQSPSTNTKSGPIKKSISSVTPQPNELNSSEDSTSKDDQKVSKSENQNTEKTTYNSEKENNQKISRIWTTMGASVAANRFGAGVVGPSAGGGAYSGSGAVSSEVYSGVGAGIGSSGTKDTSLFQGGNGGGSNTSSKSTTYSQADNDIRQRINPDGSITPQDPSTGEAFASPKDRYQARVLPTQKPTGTGEAIADYASMLSPEDKKIFDRLSKSVRVLDNDSVGFDSGSLTGTAHAQSGLASKEFRDQALAGMVDALKKDPNVDRYLENLEKRGGMNLVLSDKLSYGLNKSVGGYVQSGETGSLAMAVPKDLTDFTHSDIFRHEMMHVMDRLADDKLDGLMVGEDKAIQDLMVRALEKFQASEYDPKLVEQLDVNNLRYGAGYLKYKNDDEKKMFTYTEARAVLEQEYADKPEEFRAVGGEFAKLADHFEKRTATYKDSYVQKDGKKDGTALM
jgi:hypothetical protein